jgi:beta-lactam-binding protein with PASTA domain
VRLVCMIAFAVMVALVGVSTGAASRVLVSSSTTTSVRVPHVIGKKLPLAELLIRRAGLRIGAEDCDCTFGVVIKSNWYVCRQWPHAGKAIRRGTRVSTYSLRDMIDC